MTNLLQSQKRTRQQLIEGYADNDTGAINEKTFRDTVVSVMPEEFQNPSDYWRGPNPREVEEDGWRGWADYSQFVDENVNFGEVLHLTDSCTWRKANMDDSGTIPALGLALNSYSAGCSTATVLREGLIWQTEWSGRISTQDIHAPVYLQSGVGSDGRWSVTSTGSNASNVRTAYILGYVEMPGHPKTSTGASVASDLGLGKWRFQPEWWIRITHM